MTSKICKCGHVEREHGTQVEPSEPSLERLFIKPCYRCPCKKFEEERGCGRLYCFSCQEFDDIDEDDESIPCGTPGLTIKGKERDYFLCSNCEKPKNHSPEDYCLNERPPRKTFCQLKKGHKGSHSAVILWE